MLARPVNGNNVAPTNGTHAATNGFVIDCHIKELHYGRFKAVRDAQVAIKPGTITAFSARPDAGRAPCCAV